MSLADMLALTLVALSELRHDEAPEFKYYTYDTNDYEEPIYERLVAERYGPDQVLHPDD